jgi:hypothetical protein
MTHNALTHLRACLEPLVLKISGKKSVLVNPNKPTNKSANY